MTLETEVRLTWLWLVVVGTAVAWQAAPWAALLVAFLGYVVTMAAHAAEHQKAKRSTTS